MTGEKGTENHKRVLRRKELTMGCFDGMDLESLFDSESSYGKNYTFPAPSEEMIRRAEKTMGYPLPPSYRELLMIRNGGCIRSSFEDAWLAAIYGISPDPGNFYGLEEMFDNWRNNWEYPDIGIPFGETESAGHDMYYLDFRALNEKGEPRVVRVDNEMDNEVWSVADDLPSFLRLILSGAAIEETRLTDQGEQG